MGNCNRRPPFKKNSEKGVWALRYCLRLWGNVTADPFGQSRADFAHKMSIALKEANETDYWFNLLKDADFIEEKLHLSLKSDCKSLIAMLVSTVKKSKP